MFFDNYPETVYITDKYRIVLLTDILKTYRIKNLNQTNDLIPYSIKDGDTPESLSFRITETTADSWIILAINKIYDLYHGWPMDSGTFNKFITKKYDNKICLFVDTMQVVGTFEPKQQFTVLNSSLNQVASGEIVEWDRTLSKIVIQNTIGPFQEIATKLQDGTEKYIFFVDNNNKAKLGRVVLINSQALHHFQGENGLYIDPHAGALDSYILQFENVNVITNYDYENELNDLKRKILLPSKKLIQEIKRDLVGNENILE